MSELDKATGREPGHAHEAEIEAAREAWTLAVVDGGGSRAMLRRVLAAVEPLIRERLAQEVEAEANAVKIGPLGSLARQDTLMDAARIVRGDAS